METRNIAVACQGGGSHAAYTAGVLPVLLAGFDNLGAARAGPAPAYREPGTPAGVDVPVLAAISGTSGGAISALLGWYGFITGGAPEARRRLDAFWDANAATHWVESGLNRMMRALGDAAAMWGWDIKSSPYSPLMAGGDLAATLAGACGTTAGIDPADAGAAGRAIAGSGALVIDGASLYGARGAARCAVVRWRAQHARVAGVPVRIEGRSELADDGAADAMAWRVTDVRITAMVPTPPDGGPAAARLADWHGQALPDGRGRPQ